MRKKVYNRKIVSVNMDIELYNFLIKKHGHLSGFVNEYLEFVVKGHNEYVRVVDENARLREENKRMKKELNTLKQENARLLKKVGKNGKGMSILQKKEHERQKKIELILPHVRHGARFKVVLNEAGIYDKELQLQILRDLFRRVSDDSWIGKYPEIENWMLVSEDKREYVCYVFKEVQRRDSKDHG